ncbi:MAG: hypothetical protein NUV51_09675, partial [Sulfuricaulis sp.]|nr:hypothetical protein [Sulfuricaulis sp.]
MATFSKFNDFAEQLALGTHNLNTATFKIALTNSAPVATNTVLANITQIANGNGYTTGGSTVPNTALSETSGTATFVGDAVTFTASGSSMAAFQYAVIYNDTATNDELVGWWDYGSALTLAVGETFTVKPSNAATGGTIL